MLELCESATVPISNISHQFIQNIQIWLKSNSQAIEVYLCPDDIKKEPEDNIANEASSSSASDEHLSEDSTSCDSFKSKLLILCPNVFVSDLHMY